MLSSNRVIWKDNATLRDLSTKLNNFYSDTQVIDFATATDKLYIGSDVPFNNRFIMMSVVNAVDASMTIEIWDGNSWVAVVDVKDYTQATAGKPLSQSGIIAWVTDRNKSWAKEATTEEMAGSGLETLKIYNMYWVRIGFSANLTDTMAIKYVGHKFSKDEDMKGYYPDLNRSTAMAAYETGKTSWEEQHILAAEAIFVDLRAKRELWAKGQIFNWEALTMAAVHKVAEIVYSGFGAEYEVRMDTAQDRYEAELGAALSQGIDKDADGHIDEEEQVGMCVGLTRR